MTPLFIYRALSQVGRSHSSSGMSTSALMRETKRAHPKAKKKEIVRAAFAAVITIADNEIEKARLLQNFALDARGPGDPDET